MCFSFYSMKRVRGTLDNFLLSPPNKEPKESVECNAPTDSSPPINISASTSSNSENKLNRSFSTQDQEDYSSNPCLLDINDAVNLLFMKDKLHSSSKLTDQIKFNFLMERYQTSLHDYNFPIRHFGSKKLKFQLTWLQKWEWLSYSKKSDAAFCRYCVFFCQEGVGKGSHEKLGSLVTTPFFKWKDAIEKFTSHTKSHYHRRSTLLAENFLKVFKGEKKDIATEIDSYREILKQENRQKLIPIIDTIIFCGEQELPLRGHRDSGPLDLANPKFKDGKFRALLRFRTEAGDNNLKKHIENSTKNATYTSPDIQNEIIKICGNIIQEKIAIRVNKASCFSIICDETCDFSGIEQVAICVRYLSEENIYEDFLSFVPASNLTAENMTHIVISECERLGFNLNNLVGQGYDGASTMSGCFNGVQARIKDLYPKAMFVHCASHRLNLVLSASMSETHVRNTLGVVKDIINFMRNNIVASDTLKKRIVELVPQARRSRLIQFCETRFIERHDAIIVFVELLKPIVACLEELSESERSISSKAFIYLAAMKQSSFLISLLSCEKLLSFTATLSIYLQSPKRDLSSALTFAQSTLERLQHIRNEPIDYFAKEIFEKAQELMQEIFGAEIKIPRLTKVQAHRSNYVDTKSPQEYYRISVFIPSLDSLIFHLENRFNDHNSKIISSLEILLPANSDQNSIKQLKNLEIFYDSNFSFSELESEYILWCDKWAKEQPKPANPLDVLSSCDVNFFPAIHYLLSILNTLPVTTCSAERSFSCLKRVKTYLRNKMCEDRLVGLALLSIYHGREFVTSEEVIDKFAIMNRKILL